ncbi:hypothetical protein PGT21_004604 [Puccinia graminis f. sp. tritici]|uniref:Uncharacterized protein n=1 Tax=Puccinia graminis f. sp. tritici TaxID=56615 RepID=A0A5B0M2N3_PUCGR|nr:hypothetical protein PGT21_004604 [Puccinia graminis f. sp. tritici]
MISPHTFPFQSPIDYATVRVTFSLKVDRCHQKTYCLIFVSALKSLRASARMSQEKAILGKKLDHGVSVIPQLREDVFATGFRRLNDRRQRSKVIYRFFIAVSLIWITSRMAWFLLSLITREPLACERSLNINGSSRTGRGHAVIGLNR